MGDESNRTAADGEFFIYGGLIIPTENLGDLTRGVIEIRERFKLPSEQPLKFSTNAKPQGWEYQEFHDLRSEVLRLSNRLGAKMVVYVFLHAMAGGNSAEVVQRFGINSVLNRYSEILKAEETWGLAMIDRDNAVFKNIREIHQRGLDFHGRRVNLSPQVASVLAFDSNGSHLASAADIAVSSFRFCVNTLPRQGEQLPISQSVASKYWYEELRGMLPTKDDGSLDMSSPNVLFRPIEQKHPPYNDRYKALTKHIAELVN